MSDIEKLKDRIIGEAKEKAEKIKNEAEQNAYEIENEAKKSAVEIIDNAKEKALKEGNNQKDRIKADSELEARNREIAVKQKVIDMVFDRAVYKISSMGKYEYTNFVKNLLLNNVETGDEEIIISEMDKSRLELDMIDEVNEYFLSINKKGNLTIKVDEDIISPGFILRGNGVEINCTIDSIVMSLRDRIDTEIANIIFDK